MRAFVSGTTTSKQMLIHGFTRRMEARVEAFVAAVNSPIHQVSVGLRPRKCVPRHFIAQVEPKRGRRK